MKKAVCLLSGGLDSSVCSYKAKSDGNRVYCITFDYNQRHRKEIRAARRIAEILGAEKHLIIKINLSSIGGSALTDRSIEVPDAFNYDREEIPITYVPMRNIIFLSIAASWAEVIGADSIYIGANAVDFSGYPDCRPEFYQVMAQCFRVGSKRGVSGDAIEIKTPLINMSKKDIVMLGMELNVPFHLTWSCYRGGRFHCGRCDSCLLRLKGFKEAGIKDPVKYEGVP